MSAMKRPTPKTFKNCPHFLKGMKTCNLFSDGFYIPTQRNISTYCLTSIYDKCPVYYRHYHMKDNPTKSQEQRRGNRRRHKRIPDHRKVMLRSCDPHGNLSGDFCEMALTVDYSQGGMHVISNKKIPDEQLLMFRFDEDFLIPQFEGFASLCWQKKNEKSPQRVEAGLIFKNDTNRKSLALEIEYQHLNTASLHLDFPKNRTNIPEFRKC